MSTVTAQQRSAGIRLDAGIVTLGVMVLSTVLLASYAWSPDVGDTLTRNTVRLALSWYAAALVLMMRLQPSDWSIKTLQGRAARWCWTWGLACFLVHLAMAFHFYHHWSHAEAFEHTRQVSGSGEGIYVSYLFTWLWIADVIWWWAWPERYAARSPWIDRALHGFMLFIVFNGMVVFESGVIRWAGLAMFAILIAAWLFLRGLPRLRPA